MLIKFLDVRPGARRSPWLTGVLVPGLVLCAGLAHGQTLQTGTIIGNVRDNQGGAATGVTVTLTSPVLITARTDATNAEGSYRFPALPPGTYTIEAVHEKLGRQTQTVTLGEKDAKEIVFTFKPAA